MMSDRRIKGFDVINDQCLKKKFGIYKEPKIILCRHKEVLTSSIPPKYCATLASDIIECPEKHIKIKELASNDAAKVINMDESSKIDSCFRKRYGIVQDVKVVLMQPQDKNLADSQNTAYSSIPAINNNGAPIGAASKNKQVEFHKSMLNVPPEDISENIYFENETKRFVHSHKFCVPTKIRNPMAIDETIREEKIARLKRRLAEQEENLEKIRRK